MLIQDRIDLEHAMRAAGLVIDHIEPGTLIRCSTEGDKPGQRSGWYRLFDEGDPITCVFGDWRDGSRVVWTNTNQARTPEQHHKARQRVEQARREREAEQHRQWAENRTRMLAMWREAQPIVTGDPVARYLTGRGLRVPHTQALRYHDSLIYWGDGVCLGVFPAMLAAVTSRDGELINVHRTYLTMEGQKANVPTVRKLSPSAGFMAGASIKIGDPAPRPDGRLGLGVAEGIETALAASMLGDIPVWPCVSTSGLTTFVAPDNVHHLYIFADHDENEAGQNAAQQLGVAMTGRGHSVRIHTPCTAGDWNDELLAREVPA